MRGTPFCTAVCRGLHNLFHSQPGAILQAELSFNDGFGVGAHQDHRLDPLGVGSPHFRRPTCTRASRGPAARQAHLATHLGSHHSGM
eukprot:2413975-Heterocapsa_arctica.AAC.1